MTLNLIFTDCLKHQFKEHSTIGAEHKIQGVTGKMEIFKYPNCTMPWHQSMLGIQKYNDTDWLPCNQTDGYTLYVMDYDYIKQAAAFNYPKCEGML